MTDEERIKRFVSDLSVFSSNLRAAFTSVVADLSSDVGDFLSAIPSMLLNPFSLLENLALLVTSVSGRFVVIPIVSAKIEFSNALQKAGLKNRLVKIGDASDAFFEMWEEGLQDLTLTNSSGIIAVITAALARFVYRTVKKFKLIRSLISAQSEAEFVALIVRSIIRGLRRTAWVIIIFFMLVTLFWFCMTVSLLLFYDKPQILLAKMLSQDSKKRYVPVADRAPQKRINQKTGPDF